MSDESSARIRLPRVTLLSRSPVGPVHRTWWISGLHAYQVPWLMPESLAFHSRPFNEHVLGHWEAALRCTCRKCKFGTSRTAWRTRGRRPVLRCFLQCLLPEMTNAGTCRRVVVLRVRCWKSSRSDPSHAVWPTPNKPSRQCINNCQTMSATCLKIDAFTVRVFIHVNA